MRILYLSTRLEWGDANLLNECRESGDTVYLEVEMNVGGSWFSFAPLSRVLVVRVGFDLTTDEVRDVFAISEGLKLLHVIVVRVMKSTHEPGTLGRLRWSTLVILGRLAIKLRPVFTYRRFVIDPPLSLNRLRGRI